MVDVSEYYQMVHQENIMVSYKGNLDGDTIDVLLQLTERKLTTTGAERATKKKIINIMVECLQNSFHYTTKFEPSSTLAQSTFFILTLKNGKYQIATGNLVEKDNIFTLQKRLEVLEQMSDDEIQDFYLQTLNKAELPISGGAGLGLIDIVRRAGNKPAFNFETYPNDFVLFSMQIDIKN